MINYQSEKFAIMEERGKVFRKEFMEMYEECIKEKRLL